MSYNMLSGEFALKAISRAYKHENTPRLIKLTLSNNITIQLTPGHPLLTTEGWKSRDYEESLFEHGVLTTLLNIGDTLIGYKENVIVKNIEELSVPDNYTTYNAEVDDYHTFIAEGIVAHNVKLKI